MAEQTGGRPVLPEGHRAVGEGCRGDAARADDLVFRDDLVAEKGVVEDAVPLDAAAQLALSLAGHQKIDLGDQFAPRLQEPHRPRDADDDENHVVGVAEEDEESRLEVAEGRALLEVLGPCRVQLRVSRLLRVKPPGQNPEKGMREPLGNATRGGEAEAEDILHDPHGNGRAERHLEPEERSFEPL